MVRKCWIEAYVSAKDLYKDLVGLNVSTISKDFTTDTEGKRTNKGQDMCEE